MPLQAWPGAAALGLYTIMFSSWYTVTGRETVGLRRDRRVGEVGDPLICIALHTDRASRLRASSAHRPVRLLIAYEMSRLEKDGRDREFRETSI